MNFLNTYDAEVTEKLTAASATDTKSKFPDLQKYIGTRYQFIGLSVPTQRKIFKIGYSFSHLSLAEQLQIWEGLWQQSHIYEVLTQCIYFIEKYILHLDSLEVWNITRCWVRKIDNWAHSDGLSDIYAHLMEKHPALVYNQFTLWNGSSNPWERRQTVVGLIYYNKKRKAMLPATKLLKMVQPLLKDENYFVQKGVGWALRECGNAYPEQTLEFLHQYCTLIHPVAFTAAIEKRTAEEKETLKQVRKSRR